MRIIPFLVATSFAGVAPLQECSADGGTVRLRETRGDLRITIFTSPIPIRASEIDVSVLVQDRAGHVQNVRIDVVARPRGMPETQLRVRATREAATNKLLQAAQFKLPRAGWWSIEVIVHLPDEPEQRFSFQVEAAPTLPRWITFWPWFSWPGAAIASFGWHQWLIRHKLARQRKRLFSNGRK